MSITATCPCGARFAANDQLAGKNVRCPTCGQVFLVPAGVNPALRPPTAQPTLQAAAGSQPAFKGQATQSQKTLWLVLGLSGGGLLLVVVMVALAVAMSGPEDSKPVAKNPQPRTQSSQPKRRPSKPAQNKKKKNSVKPKRDEKPSADKDKKPPVKKDDDPPADNKQSPAPKKHVIKTAGGEDVSHVKFNLPLEEIELPPWKVPVDGLEATGPKPTDETIVLGLGNRQTIFSSPAAARMAVSRGGEITIYDLTTGAPIAQVQAGGKTARMMDFSTDGTCVLVLRKVSAMLELSVWKVNGSTLETSNFWETVSSAHSCVVARFAGSDHVMALTDYGFDADPKSGVLKLWKIANGKEVYSRDWPRYIPKYAPLVISPGGKYYVEFSQGIVAFRRCDTDQLVGQLGCVTESDRLWGAEFSWDGKRLAAVFQYYDQLMLICWDLETGRMTHKIYLPIAKSYSMVEPYHPKWCGAGYVVVSDYLVDLKRDSVVWHLSPGDTSGRATPEKCLWNSPDGRLWVPNKRQPVPNIPLRLSPLQVPTDAMEKQIDTQFTADAHFVEKAPAIQLEIKILRDTKVPAEVLDHLRRQLTKRLEATGFEISEQAERILLVELNETWGAYATMPGVETDERGFIVQRSAKVRCRDDVSVVMRLHKHQGETYWTRKAVFPAALIPRSKTIPKGQSHWTAFKNWIDGDMPVPALVYTSANLDRLGTTELLSLVK